jgi:serine-type D-Ala-D-Ala carboxypeptidase (penicillin-binding protein 5/6)
MKNDFKLAASILATLAKSKSFLFASFSIIFLFVFAISFLVTTPQMVKLVDSSLVLAQNEVWKNPQYIKPVATVAGIAKKPQVNILNNNIIPPVLNSRAVIAIDAETGKVLFEKNAHERLSPASTTKIMTALVAKSHFRAGDVLRVTQESLVGGSTMGLSLGEEMSFRSLLYGMMLNSGNDAAFTVASNYPGGVFAFVQKMNEKVAELELADTHFQNPAGFDNQYHYSSAFDLAHIAKVAVDDPQISRIVSTKDTDVMSWDKAHRHELSNLNKLLGQDGVIGIKTGTTDLAGESLVGLVERDGHKVITVVLNSPDRFFETRELIDWVYSNYKWVAE